MKKIILITGTFTSGKSTIADDIVNNNDVIIIPQATIRKKRSDDSPEFFRYLSKEEYDNQQFFSCFGNYGILQYDITNFFKNVTNNNAVCVVSAPDIQVFLNKLPRKNLFLILKTLTSTLTEEKEMILSRFPNFFEGENLKNRIDLAINLSETYFFNADYNRNFDLLLPLNEKSKEIDINGIHFSTKYQDNNEKRGKVLCKKY